MATTVYYDLPPAEKARWEAAERATAAAWTKRRWTKKDDIAKDYVVKFWRIIPKGPFRGEYGIRVFIQIEYPDGRRRRVHPDAVIFARLDLADARRAGLVWPDGTLRTEYIFVPESPGLWVAGALTFDKIVLLSIWPGLEGHYLERKDAWIGEELVWINPFKGRRDLRLRYLTLRVAGMAARVTNPGPFAPVQRDPSRHFCWEIVDEIYDQGITTYGDFEVEFVDERGQKRVMLLNGEWLIKAIKMRLVNWLLTKADQFQEERWQSKARIGDPGTEREPITSGFEAINGSLSRTEVDRAFDDRMWWCFGEWPQVPSAERQRKLDQWHRLGDACDVFRLIIQSEEALSGWGDLNRLVSSGLGDYLPKEQRKALINALGKYCIQDRSQAETTKEKARRIAQAPVDLIDDAKDELWQDYIKLNTSEVGLDAGFARLGTWGARGRGVVRGVFDFFDFRIQKPLGLEFDIGTVELTYALIGATLSFRASNNVWWTIAGFIAGFQVGSKLVRGGCMKSRKAWAQTLGLFLFLGGLFLLVTQVCPIVSSLRIPGVSEFLGGGSSEPVPTRVPGPSSNVF